MRFLRAIARVISAPFRWRQRRLLLAMVTLASFGVLGVALVGLLLANDSQEPPVIVRSLPTATPTATPVPTPTPSDAAIARLIIDRIGVDAAVIALGLDENALPQTFDDPYDAVWYDFSGKPGWGSNAVFSGHVDWTLDGQPVPGVFYWLDDVAVGDVVEIKLEDGTDYKYRVIANLQLLDGDPKILDLMGATPFDMITLVTWGHYWKPVTHVPGERFWSQRTVVRAELMSAPSSDGARSGGPPSESSER